MQYIVKRNSNVIMAREVRVKAQNEWTREWDDTYIAKDLCLDEVIQIDQHMQLHQIFVKDEVVTMLERANSFKILTHAIVYIHLNVHQSKISLLRKLGLLLNRV